jgi:hypothetical protein
VVDNAPVLIEKIEPRWFGGVGFADVVIHVVDVGWIPVAERGFAALRHLAALNKCLGILDIQSGAGSVGHHSRREIPSDPPAVRWVGFSNVYADELNILVEPFKDLAETPGPGSVRGSGEAAKNEHDWPPAHR